MLFNITNEFLDLLHKHTGVRVTFEELKQINEQARADRRSAARERLVKAGQRDLFDNAA